MLKLYDAIYDATSMDEAITRASKYTEFSKDQFKCKVIKEPIKKGLIVFSPFYVTFKFYYRNFFISKF